MKETYVSDMGFQRKELVTSFSEGIPIQEEIITPPYKPEDNEPLEDDATDDPCEFPDLSGVWVCEGKGHFELRQTNEEIDGDCVSFIEGKFIRYNCTEDLWAMSQKDISYVRGKIVNGQYTIEIFPQKNKSDIGKSRTQTVLSGTVSVGAESFNPSMQFGLSEANKGQSTVVDPHSGQPVIQMQWHAPPPITMEKNKCEFKKTSKYNVQEAGSYPCKKCKKQELEDGLAFSDERFALSDEKLYVEDKDASNPLYAVGSGVAQEGGPTREVKFTSDLMNDQVNLVPRYNVRMTKVERDGKFIDVFYEICDWKTGKKIKASKTYHITGLTEQELNLPNDSPTIQKEFRKAGAFVYNNGVLKEIEKNK
jgi:hypothetical protein